tara:strand:+ start:202 stop:450 length:249 start_codon:yes stop_codon:yes gene_type:complete
MHHAELKLSACHTVGMLLQVYGERDEAVRFVAYHRTHPLERTIVLKIATHGDETVSVVLRRLFERIHADLARVQSDHFPSES